MRGVPMDMTVRKRLFLTVACGLAAGLTGSPRMVAAQTVATELVELRVDTVLDGLSRPVAMTFVSETHALLAERAPARLTLVDTRRGTAREIRGLPPILDGGDGGLLDVVVSDDAVPWIYLAYTSVEDGDPVTTLDRLRIDGDSVTVRERLFAATESRGDTVHFGGRVALADDHVFLAVGERYDLPEAQSLSSFNGTVVRLHRDGRVPADNPFRHIPGALPEVWSFGHRNPQGMAIRPATGALWLHEHGPQGGDEVNVVLPGQNYGWPVVTYGEEYGGGPIGDGVEQAPGFEEPIWYWRPSIGPSDMFFHSGNGIPEWRGNLLLGAMAQRHLNRLVVRDGRVLHEERILGDQEWRIRMVEEGPDGSVYLGTDSGLLVRLSPIAGGS